MRPSSFLIFFELHIQGPTQVVFDCPMATPLFLFGIFMRLPLGFVQSIG
jgi:hypothetical protein